ncbi:MAG TPA: preprotein translocase subunit YajC [Blastocatellia bacterium]
MNITSAPDIIATSLAFQASGGGGGGNFSQVFLLPMIVVFGIFYFLVIRPQQKKQRQAQTERDRLLSALKAGDKVITNGGIYGTLIAVNEKTVQLRIAQSVSIQVSRSSIADLQESETAKEVEAARS